MTHRFGGVERRNMARRGSSKLFAAGSRGHRVALVRRRGRRTLSLRYSSGGRVVRRGLGHADVKLGRMQCEELAEALRRARDRGRWSGVLLPATSRSGLTVKSLMGQYRDEVVCVRRSPARREGERRLAMWESYLAEQGVHAAQAIDTPTLETFARRRRAGLVHIRDPRFHVREAKAQTLDRQSLVAPPVVSARTVQADLEFLRSVLRWAARRRDTAGHPLLAGPLPELPRGRPSTPRRPVAARASYRALLRVADAVDPQELLGLFLRLMWALGWRVTALCNLCADHIQLGREPGFPYGRIYRDPLLDKENVEQWVPLTRLSAIVARRLLARSRSGPFLFPAPRTGDGRRGWSRFHARDLLERAQVAAGVTPIGGFHAIRRRWATDRKWFPAIDVMRAGGWRDERTLRVAYTASDQDTTYDVIANRWRRESPAHPDTPQSVTHAIQRSGGMAAGP